MIRAFRKRKMNNAKLKNELSIKLLWYQVGFFITFLYLDEKVKVMVDDLFVQKTSFIGPQRTNIFYNHSIRLFFGYFSICRTLQGFTTLD